MVIREQFIPCTKWKIQRHFFQIFMDNSMRNKIKEQYMAYVLEHGHEPESIFKFAKKLKIEESEFYDNYNSFKQINAEFWKHLVEETIRPFFTWSPNASLMALVSAMSPRPVEVAWALR